MKPVDVYSHSRVYIAQIAPVPVVRRLCFNVPDRLVLILSYTGASTDLATVFPSFDGNGFPGIPINGESGPLILSNDSHGPLTQCEWWGDCPGIIVVTEVRFDCSGGAAGLRNFKAPIPGNF